MKRSLAENSARDLFCEKELLQRLLLAILCG